MTYQLEKQVADRLKAFFEPFDFIDKVVIFGSRAKHNANPKSDIDLCIYSLEMSDAQFSKLKLSLDELPILYAIDIVHFEKSNEALRENIARDGKLLFAKQVKLTAICQPKQHQTISKKDMSDNGKYLLYGANGVIGKTDKYTHENEALLITCRGATCGTLNISKPMSYVNGNAMALDKLIDKVSLKYLYYYLLQRRLDDVITGSAQPQITKENLEKVNVYLPSLTKQKEIAQTLDKAGELIELRKATIQKLDELAQSIFIDMFGDPVENPKGWDVNSVDTGCDEIVDCINRTAPLSENKTEYKMIRTTNVKKYKIVFNETRYVEQDIYDQWVRRLVPQKYDVVFTREAPVGEAGIITTDEKLFLGQRTMLFRPNPNRLNSYYLLYELMGNKVKTQIDKISTGSTVKHLSVPDCKKFEINLPPIELQNQFAQTIEKIESQKSLYEAELTKLQATFDALLSQSFEG